MIQFNRSDFFPKKKSLSNDNINKIIQNQVIDYSIEDKFNIIDISSLDNFRNNSILFNSTNFINVPNKIHIITDKKKIYDLNLYKNIHLVNNLDLVIRLILTYMFCHEDDLNLKDEFIFKDGSYISKYSKINDSTFVGKNCVISRGVQIGKNCIIKNNVNIKNSIISDNVIIGDNTVIGSSGFGFDLKNMGAKNITPHIGVVYINENVRIGSNCTIDRAKFDCTFIGKNSMLDNQIHIAHNVIIGSNVSIAAQSGISGSTILGNHVIMGGQSGIAGHLTIGNNVVIAAKSGVTKNIKDNSVVAGFPAVDIKEWKKNIINIKKYGYKQN